MPPKKEKKDKKPPKEKKPKVVKQKQKQSQKQVVIVNVGGRGRGRPKKAPAQAQASVLPPQIFRLNQPPVPFPLQPTMDVVRESVKPIGAESVLNFIQERMNTALEQRAMNEKIGEKRARYFENAEPVEATPFSTNSQSHSTPVREDIPQANAMFMTPQIAEAEVAKKRKERSDKNKPRAPYKKRGDTPEAGLKQP